MCRAIDLAPVYFIEGSVSSWQGATIKISERNKQIVFYTPIMKVDFMYLIFLFFNEYTDENKIIIMINLDTNLNACVRCVTLISNTPATLYIGCTVYVQPGT